MSVGELLLFLGRHKLITQDNDFQKAFDILNEFDIDKNGVLDKQEFSMMFRKLLSERVADF